MSILKEIRDKLDELVTIKELEEVNKLLKLRWDRIQQERVLEYRVGDRVSWKSRGKHRSGTVLRTNQKTVSVMEDKITVDGGWSGKWTVGPSSLSLIKEGD